MINDLNLVVIVWLKLKRIIVYHKVLLMILG